MSHMRPLAAFLDGIASVETDNMRWLRNAAARLREIEAAEAAERDAARFDESNSSEENEEADDADRLAR